MVVTIKLGEPLWRKINRREVELELEGGKVSLAGLCRDLCRQYPNLESGILTSEGQLDRHYGYIINGEIIPLVRATQVKLQDGDELLIIVPIAGG